MSKGYEEKDGSFLLMDRKHSLRGGKRAKPHLLKTPLAPRRPFFFLIYII